MNKIATAPSVESFTSGPWVACTRDWRVAGGTPSLSTQIDGRLYTVGFVAAVVTLDSYKADDIAAQAGAVEFYGEGAPIADWTREAVVAALVQIDTEITLPEQAHLWAALDQLAAALGWWN